MSDAVFIRLDMYDGYDALFDSRTHAVAPAG